MTLIFNLDLDNLTKITNYAFDLKEKPFPTIYFRLYQNGYDVDMSKFNQLTLRTRSVETGKIDTIISTKITTVNGEKLVEVKLNDSYLTKNDTFNIDATVKYSNQSIILKTFQFVIYDGSKTEMNMVKQGLSRFNHLYNLYIKAIKRDQINQPYGVVGLDKDARMSINQLPDNVGQHVQTKIRDSQIHGMRLNDEFMLEIYDPMDKEWYEATSLNFGNFTQPNKPEKYNIFGGFFTGINAEKSIHGGKW